MEELSKKNDNIILANGNINSEYEVKGLVHIETRITEEKSPGWKNVRLAELYSKMNVHFIKSAKELKGNGVINITYQNLTLPNFDFVIIGIGTVIKLK